MQKKFSVLEIEQILGFGSVSGQFMTPAIYACSIYKLFPIRIATAMFYLSDVEGGFTVFPQLRVAAKPRSVKKKIQQNNCVTNFRTGSAIFWYNLNKDGSRYENIHLESLRGHTIYFLL